ncbi:MAG: NUDIX domain-containing protein [Lachnospiraceae bacterium]|nr:NUDIX domain-containing protein [Lachnospiraceae bacterium]
MGEFLDVLDENGNYTGIAESKSKCHEKGLWHKAVAVFIINSKEQVLLQKRSPNKKAWPNMWDISAGGHVTAGEFGINSVIREIKEEIGIDVNKIDITFIGAVTSSDMQGKMKNNHFNEYYIIKKDIDETKCVLQKEEVSEVKWINKDEIIEKIKDNYNGITNKQGCWDYLIKYFEFQKR